MLEPRAKNPDRYCIKVCCDPHCEAVYHNIPKKQTKCADCGQNVMEINFKTYEKKFSLNYFQYDYSQPDGKTGYFKIYRPPVVRQLELFE